MKVKELDRLFREIHRWHRKAVECRINRTGVYRAQHQILMYLSDHPQSSQKQIADAFNISPSAVGVSLKKLEKGGYLERLVDTEDNRFHQVTLTQKGREVVCQSRQIFLQVMEEMYQGMDEEEQEILLGFYERIRENLKKICEEEQERKIE